MTTALLVGVIENPGGFESPTVIYAPLATVIAVIANVRIVPVPPKAPLDAPVRMMSSTSKLVGSASKVSVKEVVVTNPGVPFALRLENVTNATFTATFLDAGEIENPVGFASATVTFAPLATVMADIARFLVFPEPVNAPLVAPATVISSAVKLVGSTSKASVKAVVVTDPRLPFAVRPEKTTAIESSVESSFRVEQPVDHMANARLIDIKRVFFIWFSRRPLLTKLA